MYRLLLIFTLALTLLGYSCNDPITIGIPTEDDIEIIYSDTFSLNTKTLLGLRSELDFHNFAEGSHFGVTALYKSKSVNTEQAYYGNEPYQAFLVGANLRLLGESPALTQGLDYIPFLDLKETSKWRNRYVSLRHRLLFL